MLDINLLRSPARGPGTQVDFGEHSLEYALYPHEGPLGADTYREAYFLNNPIAVTAGSAPATTGTPYIVSTNPNIVAESVKLPADGRGVLVRVYNSAESEQSGELRVTGYRAAESAGVMEEALAPASEAITLRSFELRIVRYIAGA